MNVIASGPPEQLLERMPELDALERKAAPGDVLTGLMNELHDRPSVVVIASAASALSIVAP